MILPAAIGFLSLLLCPDSSAANKGIVEGVAASNNTIFIATPTTRVGVGTASPQYPLHVSGAAFVSGQEITGGTSTVNGNAFSVGASTFSVSVGSVTIGPGGILFNSGSGTSYIANGGNLGVGTVSPQATAHIRGGADSNLWMRNGGASIFDLSSIKDDNATFTTLQLGANPIALLPQTAAGKVGIGTASPLSFLDVKTGANQHWTITTSGGNIQLVSVNDAGNQTTGLVDAIPLALNSGGGGNVGIKTSNPLSALQVNGHLRFGGTAPTVSACGAAPAPSVGGGSTDNAGTVTIGGGVVTSCVLTFATTWENATAPFCTVILNTTGATTAINSVTTTSVTFGFSVNAGGSVLYYMCF